MADRIRRRAAALLGAVALAVAACSPATTPDTSADTPSTATEPPGAAAAPATAPTITQAPSAAPTTSAGVPTRSTASIGDPLYPGLGNGGYDVAHYDLDLQVDLPATGAEAPTLAATATIRADATTMLRRIHLDFAGFDLGDVTVDGATASTERDDDELVVLPATPIDAGQQFTVAISYAGAARPVTSDAAIGGVGWRTNAAEISYVVSEPDGAHSWFPSNDHPLDKATFTTTVTVPSSLTAAANGELVETADAGSRRTFRWSMDRPMAPYLATVIVGDVRIVEDEAAGDAAAVVIRHVLPADEADDPPAGLERSGEMIAFFAERFGPYPFDRYGIAVIDGLPAALETQTLTVFGRPPGAGRLDERIMAHEIAHEWFGNSVSLERWSDLWLKEGFATYASWLWAAEQLPDPPTALAQQADVAYDIAGSVGLPPTGEPQPRALYTPASYEGGALVLHALRAEVGEEAFFEIARTFAATFAYGNADTADFIAVAERVAGRDLDDLFDRWLRQPQRPPLPQP